MRKSERAFPGRSPYFVGSWATYVPGDASMQSALELRYNVYCIERRFLNADDYPDGCESDAYDGDAAHFFAHNLKRELVGYVRLVPPSADHFLPWQSHCVPLPNHSGPPHHERAAEISRLMVRQDYRRRRGDTLDGSPLPDLEIPAHERRSASPRILLTLYRQMYQYSVANDIRYWYAAMERALARSLQRLDFGFTQIGAQGNYFGPVAPYMADLRELEARLADSQPELLAWMQLPEGAAS